MGGRGDVMAFQSSPELPVPTAAAAERLPPALAPACVAEAIGTFALVFAGCGAIMTDQLSGGQVTHVGVGLVFGLVIAAMLYATGHISGAHLSPAVTLGFVLARHFPPRRLVGYWLAQLAGATAAALSLRPVLGDGAHLGATAPAGSGGAAQSVAPGARWTFFLVFWGSAVACRRARRWPRGWCARGVGRASRCSAAARTRAPCMYGRSRVGGGWASTSRRPPAAVPRGWRSSPASRRWTWW